jgi:hypothetical protein
VMKCIHRMCIPGCDVKYEIFFGVFEVKVGSGFSYNLFGEFDGHVVGVVGCLYDSADYEARCEFSQHLQLIITISALT